MLHRLDSFIFHVCCRIMYHCVVLIIIISVAVIIILFELFTIGHHIIHNHLIWSNMIDIKNCLFIDSIR